LSLISAASVYASAVKDAPNTTATAARLFVHWEHAPRVIKSDNPWSVFRQLTVSAPRRQSSESCPPANTNGQANVADRRIGWLAPARAGTRRPQVQEQVGLPTILIISGCGTKWSFVVLNSRNCRVSSTAVQPGATPRHAPSNGKQVSKAQREYRMRLQRDAAKSVATGEHLTSDDEVRVPRLLRELSSSPFLTKTICTNDEKVV
jgi:hypothetical protein